MKHNSNNKKHTESSITYIDVHDGGKYESVVVKNGGTLNQYNYPVASEKHRLSDEEMKNLILKVTPDINRQNLWFSILKPIMWHGYIKDGDFAEGRNYLLRILQVDSLPFDFDPYYLSDKLNVMSLKKELIYWDKNDAPISNCHYDEIHRLAKTLNDLLDATELANLGKDFS